jgi:hypothetical protein
LFVHTHTHTQPKNWKEDRFFECTAGGFPSLRSALVADAPAQFGRIMSGISTALLSEYEEDADGADEAAKAAILEVFAGGDPKESHWLTHRLLWAVTWAARDVPTNAVANSTGAHHCSSYLNLCLFVCLFCTCIGQTV